MAHHTSTVVWERGDARFTNGRYSRVHRWTFDGGTEVRASSSPEVVPAPLSDPAAVDPEEAFVASLSSCHMLWFLHFAAREGFVVERYEDGAEGTMGKDRGKTAMTRVTLRPRVTWAGQEPGEDEEAALHHRAHEACFLASSVRTEIVVEPAAPPSRVDRAGTDA